MFEISQIFPLAITLAQIFLSFTLIITLLKIRVHWWITFLYSIALMFLTSEHQWVMLAIFFISAFIYYFFAAKKQWKLTFLAIVLHLFSSQFIASVMQFIFLGLMPFIEIDVNLIFIFSIFTYIVLLAVIKYKRFSLVNLIHQKMIFTLSTLMMLISVAMFTYAPITREEFLNPDNLHNSLWVIVIKFVVAYMAFTLNRLATEIEKNEQHKLYIKTLEESLDRLSMYEHDFGNMINSLLGYCRMKRLDKIEAYLKEIAGEIHKDADIGTINFHLKDNIPCLYGVVLAKYSKTTTNHIDFEIEVTAEKFDLKATSELQLSRMVGILLDNALEATKQSKRKEITLKISNIGWDNRLKITISNFVDAPVDMTKLREKGYTTKKGHSGIGLYEIQSIVEEQRKEGLNVGFEIYSAENTFTVELIV